MIKKYCYSLDEFNADVPKLAEKIYRSGIVIDGIYGVPQGGISLALALSNKLNLPLVDDYVNSHVLVVDDLIDSGKTRKEFPHNYFACLHEKKNKAVSASLRKKTFSLYKNVQDWIVYWWEASEETSINSHVLRMLEYVGEDPNREGLKETPSRVVKSWEKLYGGYAEDPKKVLKVFKEGACDEMVILKNIEMFSTCEHHLLPFFGKAHIAYIPNKKVVGVSKLARLLEIFTRRMQIQERIGDQVTTVLMKELEPLGAACIIEAQHFCMLSRGVEKQNSIMITSSLKGAFKDKENSAAREELMRLIR